MPWAIRYEDGTFHPDHRVPIEIVNIPVPITHEAIVKEYLMHASFVQRTNFKILAAVFARIFDKEDVDPVLLAAGAVPLSLLISQARTMIEQSHNFKAMVAELRTSC